MIPRVTTLESTAVFISQRRTEILSERQPDSGCGHMGLPFWLLIGLTGQLSPHNLSFQVDRVVTSSLPPYSGDPANACSVSCSLRWLFDLNVWFKESHRDTQRSILHSFLTVVLLECPRIFLYSGPGGAWTPQIIVATASDCHEATARWRSMESLTSYCSRAFSPRSSRCPQSTGTISLGR